MVSQDNILYAKFERRQRLLDLLDISNVIEPKISINAIDRLVMKVQGNKSMIKAICETYTQRTSLSSPTILEEKERDRLFYYMDPREPAKH